MTHGHDVMPQPPPAEPGVLRLRVDPAAIFDEVKLRATPGLARALLAQLEEQGAEASYAAEFGIDSGQLLIVALMMRDNGAWMTLRTAIEAVANRHKGARIRIELGPSTVEIEGKITPEAEALLRQVREIYEADSQRADESSSGADSGD